MAAVAHSLKVYAIPKYAAHQPILVCVHNDAQVMRQGVWNLIDSAAITKFWAGFSGMPGVSGSGLNTAGVEQAAGDLARISQALVLEGAPMPGGFEITISAQGVLRHFPLARAVAAAAPSVNGLRVKALRSSRPVPDVIALDGIEVPVAKARVNAMPVLSRYGILLLLSGVKISDYVLFRNLGKRIVMDAIGEERFGHFITDVQVMDHAEWETGAPGQLSLPLADLTSMLPPAPGNTWMPGNPALGLVQDNSRAA